MPTTAGQKPSQQERPATDRRRETSNLTIQYGAIGIPAVAAALRYTVVAKNPAYAPVLHLAAPDRAEMAA